MPTFSQSKSRLFLGVAAYLASSTVSFAQAPSYGELAAAIRSADFPCARVIETFAADGDSTWNVQCNSGNFLVSQDKDGNYSVSKAD
jgi:hypothetical protein